MAPREYGIYVHIPFCRQRCDYCAFVTSTEHDDLIDRYVDACVAQLLRERRESDGIPATVFFGGGTPSRLSGDQVRRIVDACGAEATSEVTLECNPEDLTALTVHEFAAAGINRLSIGVQSTQPNVLKSLGRRSPENALEGIEQALHASDLRSWNLDLIYGAAGESDADFAATVESVLAMAVRPPHLSAYGLSVEPGTPIARDPLRHPNEDHQADRYEWLDSRLVRAGYRFEEISSWSLPGHECRHNNLYWSGGDYLAIGTAAHGHRDGRRYWNTASIERYITAIETGASPVAGEETLTSDERWFESATLALRTARGVPWEWLDHAGLRALESRGPFVVHRGGRAVLTVQGRLFANRVAQFLRPFVRDGSCSL